MEDDFNLHGLSSVVPNYEYALDLILDRDSDVQFSEEQAEMIQASAEMLYGLIHARYILTARGLEQMLDKYNNQVRPLPLSAILTCLCNALVPHARISERVREYFVRGRCCCQWDYQTSPGNRP